MTEVKCKPQYSSSKIMSKEVNEAFDKELGKYNQEPMKKVPALFSWAPGITLC